MHLTDHLRLLADYNAWMNGQLYDAAARLPAAELAAPKGAFFGSILGTLNHLVVADTIWLQRFARHPAGASALQTVAQWPAPAALNQILFDTLPALRTRREALDALITQWVDQLDDAALASPLHYRNTRGEAFTRHLHAVLVHVFNHQTHHRGQVTTLLSQAGVDPGVTDLLTRIPQLTA